MSDASSGYCGWSKSRRAVAAEADGLLPLPLSRIGGGRYIRAAAQLVGPREWHHASKFFNRVDYYDARQIRAVAAMLRARKMDFDAVCEMRTARTVARTWERSCWERAATYRQHSARYAAEATSARQSGRDRSAAEWERHAASAARSAEAILASAIELFRARRRTESASCETRSSKAEEI